MADFKEIQKKYTEAKRLFEAASQDNYLARQQALLSEKKINLVLKEKHLAKHALSKQKNAAAKKSSDTKTKLTAAQKTLTAARKALQELSTSSKGLPVMDDAFPVLLMPLQIQTRFATIKYIARNIPDEFLVDAAKLTPPQAETLRQIFPRLQPTADPLRGISSQAYSLSANANPLSRRLIAELNGNVVSRAGKKRWQKTEDSFALCVRIFPDDLFLQTHETAITENELAAAKTFWQKMWDAERVFKNNQGDAAAAIKLKNDGQLSAWKQLRIECLPHRANWLVRVMRPPDFPDNLSIDTVTIPADKFPTQTLKSDSWTIPPATELLPEQFVVKIFFKNPNLQPKEVTGAAIPDYMQLGFDPDEQDDASFAEKGQVLELPKEIRWLTDLDEAEKSGMAIRVPLTPMELVSGIAKLVVLGIKTSADPAEGSRLITRLFDNHRYRPDGMAFLPQGTATNNLPGRPAGFSNAGLSDEDAFKLAFPPNAAADPLSDGQRFVTALGLDATMATGLFNSDGRDAEKSLQMNRALWPGTMGYYLNNMMRPGLTDSDIAFTKTFFQQNVSGRGLLPSFRVGKQPYGIVPATSWQSWKPNAGASAEENRLVAFLKKMDVQWAGLVSQVKTMKKVFANTDEATMKTQFRELLACQASSTRYFRRLVAGEYLLWNVNAKILPQNTEKAGIKTTPASYKTKLEAVGAWNQVVSPLTGMLGKFLDDDNYKLTDTAPEDTGVITPLMPNGKNYLGMLLDASIDQLKTNAYGDDFGKFVIQRSSKLLFYMARFSILQEWISAATAMVKKEKPTISPLANMDFEMEYLVTGNTLSNEHKSLLAVTGSLGNFETRKNKWAFLDELLAGGTKTGDTISQQLANAITAGDPLQALKETRAAMEAMAGLPAMELDQLFNEHIDLCSFRLDAWLQALALSRLSANRKKPGADKGIFIGAYGYLENLSLGPERWVQVQEVAQPQTIVAVPSNIDGVVMPVYDFSGYDKKQIDTVKQYMFVYLGSDTTTSLVQDSNSKQVIQNLVPAQTQDAGFLLTPSLEHASTAAVLRAGYEHHALSQGPDSKTLAVNIDSQRTGAAMDMMKGINAGHSLNEQLGYFIERKMYDNPDLAQYIPNLRVSFPLNIQRNEWDGDQNIKATDKITNLALVTDGLSIVHTSDPTQPAAQWQLKLQAIFGSAQAAKDQFAVIVSQAQDQFDAVSDLVLAESVFQMVKGSPERAAAALRIASDSSDIVLPEIAKVPADKWVVTHRMAFVLNATGDLDKPWPAANASNSVMARLSPDINRWLADQLPDPSKIVVRVTGSNGFAIKLNLEVLQLQPIDFFYMMQKAGSRPQESLLAWLFLQKAKQNPGVESATDLQLSFKRETGFAASEFSIREIIPLINTIAALLFKSRPMRPLDWQLQADSAGASISPVFDNTGLMAVCNEFAATSADSPVPSFLNKLSAARTALQQNLPVGYGSPASDAAFANLINLLPQAMLLGVLEASPLCPDICDPVNAKVLVDQAVRLEELLQKRLSDAASLMSAIAALPSVTPSDQLFDKLVKTARLFAGDDFMLLPKFNLSNPDEIKPAYTDTAVAASIPEFGIEEWLQGLSMVKDNVRNYQSLINLREAVNAPGAGRHLKILQLPVLPAAASAWVGGVFPAGFTPPRAATSMAFEFSTAFVNTQLLCGLIIDDWREKIPLPSITAAAAINYNEADSEAPQCLLLAVAPEQKGAWDWNALLNTVLETMTLAKKRAVDTEIIQGTWLSQFLPAVVGPIDAKNNTPNMDFKWGGPAVLSRPIIDIVRPGDLFNKFS